MSKKYPAGRYWIGDLCYVKKIDDAWQSKGGFGDATDGFYNCNGNKTMTALDGSSIDFWVHVTAYGDGCYPSNIDFDFGVDSGTIGVVSADVAESEGHHDGIIVDIKDDFEPKYEEGTFFIGHVLIYTEDEEEIENGWC